MINFRNEKGSITVFVLASCLFFIAAVSCTQIYMQSKQTAIEREYRQIKVNYESDIDNMDDIYISLAPFYLNAEKTSDTIVFDRNEDINDHEDILTTDTSFDIIVKNNNGTDYNLVPTNYEITIVDDDKFTFAEGDRITGTIEGGALEDSNVTLNLKIKDLTNPKKFVRINVATTTPYKRSVELRFDVEQKGAIQTIEDLLNLSLNIRGVTKENIAVERYKMTRDLDFKDPNSYDNANTSEFGDANMDGITESKLIDEMTKSYNNDDQPGAGFLPIGTHDSETLEHEFRGTFNGGNYTLSNLRLHKAKQKHIGLFGYAIGADIRNLVIKDGDVYNINQTAGMLLGKAEGTTIDNVIVEGISVTAVDTLYTEEDTYAGGIIGLMESNGKITNCTNNATVTTQFTGNTTNYSGPAGGIVGRMSDCTIENCTNRGAVTGQKFVGGIAGFAAIGGSGNIKNCHNYAAVKTYITSTSVSGPGPSVGGICGYNGSDGVVDSCINHVESSVTGISNIGGIVGRNLGTIKDSYNYTSNIKGDSNVGGIYGQEASGKYSGNVDYGNV